MFPTALNTIRPEELPAWSMVTTGNDTIQENWILSLITPLQVLRGEIWYSAQRWIETDKGLARANGIRFVGEGVEIESYQPLTPIKVYN